MGIKVFLASSAELKQEREALQLLVARRNAQAQAQSQEHAQLELVICEDFDASLSPTRKQDEYNQAICDCDLLILLAAGKVGRYTEEEFDVAYRQFLQCGRPRILTYFSDAPRKPSSLRAEDQLSLLRFQAKLEGLQHFYTHYDNVDALLRLVEEQLRLLKGGQQAAEGGSSGPQQSAAQTVLMRQLRSYLSWLRERCQNIEMRGIERGGNGPVLMLPLETAYVPLRARMRGQRLYEAKGGKTGKPQPGQARGELALNELLALGSRLVVVGGPGSGKTTVLAHMAWALASSIVENKAEPAQTSLGMNTGVHQLPLPIFVPLASFARHRRKQAQSLAAQDLTLAGFISRHLIGKQVSLDLPADFFSQLLAAKLNILLLLDGLDEVANENERAEVRQCVEELLAGKPGLRAIVTCRTVAYRNGRTAFGADFQEIVVQPLEMGRHIAPMIRQAYRCIPPFDEAKSQERSEALLKSIQRLEQDRRERLGRDSQPLVDSPLIVRLLLIVDVNNRTLPDERALLFNKAILALLQVDYGVDQDEITQLNSGWEVFLDISQYLAFHMHQQGPEQGREIEEADLRRLLQREECFRPHIDAFLAQVRQRGSIMEERDGVYRFIHLAFQEFLTARYLCAVTGATALTEIFAALEPRLEDPWWREPILLLSGYRARREAMQVAPNFFARLARLGQTPTAQCCAAELAATAILERREAGKDLRADCAQHIVTLLSDKELLKQVSPLVRARMAEPLSALGDPRFDPLLYHLPKDKLQGFVRVEADPEFRVGTRRQDTGRTSARLGVSVHPNEINDRPTPTPTFYIGRYPVTVAQFRAFREANRMTLDIPALRDLGSRPVRRVTWRDAEMYCGWLNRCLLSGPRYQNLALTKLIRQGWKIALPSEFEWEKAARGNSCDSLFPWGNKPAPWLANSRESQLQDSCSVGCFPPNDLELYDMLGNVREWTRSKGGAYSGSAARPTAHSREAKQLASRVTRGGSWSAPATEARCAHRQTEEPGHSHHALGFRLALIKDDQLPLFPAPTAIPAQP
ncbi:hypothetical protein DBR47_15150 [Paucibacter sp. KBW04]|uniref:SUMF1/EgtB/PvdO family nonheme iron enzyme n=1 Tax=Paucibacter sp. KBW04 TaxID=2153361 RepID=UPI000F58A6B7|nr:SUMF1/EgtB/PvdO family nonheme iron enzyme [Paucibacter sp. KBW04]RQO57176.1 hypothetical protein DBR47_15150 [Paucibacter sp. KBW04]